MNISICLHLGEHSPDEGKEHFQPYRRLPRAPSQDITNIFTSLSWFWTPHKQNQQPELLCWPCQRIQRNTSCHSIVFWWNWTKSLGSLIFFLEIIFENYNVSLHHKGFGWSFVLFKEWSIYSLINLFFHKVSVKQLPCSRGSAGGSGRPKNKMDMVTNLRNLQSNAGDEQKPSAGTNGGRCYEVKVEEMRKQ